MKCTHCGTECRLVLCAGCAERALILPVKPGETVYLPMRWQGTTYSAGYPALRIAEHIDRVQMLGAALRGGRIQYLYGELGGEFWSDTGGYATEAEAEQELARLRREAGGEHGCE